MQKAGVPSEWASFTNDVLSIGGTVGGSAITRLSRLGAFPIFKLSSSPVINFGNELQATRKAINLSFGFIFLITSQMSEKFMKKDL